MISTVTRIFAVAWAVWLETIRRKDFYVLLILLGSLLFALLSVDIFGLGSRIRYIMDTGLLLAWLFSLVLVVNLVGRQLPREEETGTIFPLLAKPITRGEVIIGKWLGGWSAAAAATLVFYGVVWGVVRAWSGSIDAVVLIQGWMLHVAALAMIAALTLAISTRMTYGAAATTAFILVAAAYTIVPRVPELVINERGMTLNALLVLYYLLPHFEVFDLRQRIVHDWETMDWGSFGEALLYGLLVTLVFLVLAWIAYRHKRFSRRRIV